MEIITIVDRIVAIDLLTIVTIALLTHQAERYIYLDVALVYGLLSFLSVKYTALVTSNKLIPVLRNTFTIKIS